MSIEKLRGLVSDVKVQIETNASYADQCMDNLRLSLVWTAMYLESEPPLRCQTLLRGCYGAAVEAVSLLSFGLVRPAMLSLRSHYELSLQFLYYKDHPIEWRNVKEYRSQLSLPGVNKKYLKDNFPKFEHRFKKLSCVRTRKNEDCYHILSGIAHGAAINSISSATEPADLIEAEEVVCQAVDVFQEVGENACDIYVASFEGNWISLPNSIRENLKTRFCNKKASKELEF